MANSYPYDKDGYCVHCRIAQYKPHKSTCEYLIAVDSAKQQAEQEKKAEAHG